MDYEILKQPYSTEELIDLFKNYDGMVCGVIEVDFGVFPGIDEMNDLATEKLVGEDYAYKIQDISYELVGCDIDGQILHVEVTGYFDTDESGEEIFGADWEEDIEEDEEEDSEDE